MDVKVSVSDFSLYDADGWDVTFYMQKLGMLKAQKMKIMLPEI